MRDMSNDQRAAFSDALKCIALGWIAMGAGIYAIFQHKLLLGIITFLITNLLFYRGRHHLILSKEEAKENI